MRKTHARLRQTVAHRDIAVQPLIAWGAGRGYFHHTRTPPPQAAATGGRAILWMALAN
ncbi:hypothetical protein C4K23_0769 [Pseudomonas chlororaphis]|nr:hypothetical protein C4K23_0769 [Pseudomonas chlororaphis]